MQFKMFNLRVSQTRSGGTIVQIITTFLNRDYMDYSRDDKRLVVLKERSVCTPQQTHSTHLVCVYLTVYSTV